MHSIRNSTTFISIVICFLHFHQNVRKHGITLKRKGDMTRKVGVYDKAFGPLTSLLVEVTVGKGKHKAFICFIYQQDRLTLKKPRTAFKQLFVLPPSLAFNSLQAQPCRRSRQQPFTLISVSFCYFESRNWVGQIFWSFLKFHLCYKFG